MESAIQIQVPDDAVCVSLHTNAFGGLSGIMLIVVGNGHGKLSSNPGRDCLCFPSD